MLSQVRTIDVRPTLPQSPAAALVLVGDILGLLVFIIWGLYSHGLPAWEMPQHTLTTATPFLIAWLALAPIFGLYHRDTLRSYRRTLGLLVGGWLVIAFVGGLIRATRFFDGGTGLTFFIVNIVFGLLILLPWRLAVVAALRR